MLETTVFDDKLDKSVCSYKRVTMGITVSRKTAVRRKNWKILTVSRKIC